MHVHLPKPLHGWREFLGEVGVIVIGVLLALSADQLVERTTWRKHVAEAKEDLRGELQADLFNAQERVLMESCIDRRLDQLEQIIDRPPAQPWKLLAGHRNRSDPGLADFGVGQRSGRRHRDAHASERTDAICGRLCVRPDAE